jgi:putative sterol carrier protein
MMLTISKLMQHLPDVFVAENAHGVKAIIQFTFRGQEPGQWYVTIENQKCEVTPGSSSLSDLTLTVDSEDFIKLITGEMDVVWAFMQGKVQFSGDMNLALKLVNLFKFRPGDISTNKDT